MPSSGAPYEHGQALRLSRQGAQAIVEEVGFFVICIKQFILWSGMEPAEMIGTSTIHW